MQRVIVFLALAISACSGSACGGSEKKPEAPHADRVGQAIESDSPGAAPTPQTREPALTLALRVERSVDGVGLRVINRGTTTLSLAPKITLEHKQGEGFLPVAGQGLTLRLSCATNGCVKLAPGAELAAPSFLGEVVGERCDALSKPEQRGELRFVVSSCAETEHAYAPFVWPLTP